MINLDKENFEQTIETGAKVVVFSSMHCGPCRMMVPILEDINQCDVYKLDVYDDLDLANKMNVEAVPTILFLRDGKEVSRLVGVQSKAEIDEQIDSMLNG